MEQFFCLADRAAAAIEAEQRDPESRKPPTGGEGEDLWQPDNHDAVQGEVSPNSGQLNHSSGPAQRPPASGVISSTR